MHKIEKRNAKRDTIGWPQCKKIKLETAEISPDSDEIQSIKEDNSSDESDDADCKIGLKLEKEEDSDRPTKLGVKNEVYEPGPSYQDGEFGGNSASNHHHLSCELGEPNWETITMLSDKSHIDCRTARNIIVMLKSECTIPFMARYRRDQTGGLDADQLRHVKDVYEQIKTLKTKIQKVKEKLQKIGKMSPQFECYLNGVQSLEELDFIYSPYKQGIQSKAEKARALGLEDAAYLILNGSVHLNISQFIDSSKDGLKNNDQVIQSIQNIVADLFAKNEDVLKYLYQLEKTVIITIKSTKMEVSKDYENDEWQKKSGTEETLRKFEIYNDFETTTLKIQPHQVLALNRGEKLQILSVKMIISEGLQQKLSSFCERKWLHSGRNYVLRTQIFRNSFNDAYKRIISPLVIRRAKSDLNSKAQKAAIQNYAVNLKNLLLTPPVKGCSILGIDPGFSHGCKLALINNNGDLLWARIFHFDVDDRNSLKNEKLLQKIREKLIEFHCEIIVIGQCIRCRAIEGLISHFISLDFFKPELNVRYTIVNERGAASVYSCTPLAKEEFPDLDPNSVTAVFIARSLQDPLNEYVKVEPKHVGVGMYQHDIPENRLNNALDDIVSECVSFTGVDVNTASVHLLKRISGLDMAKATSIIEWRCQNGPFKNREQLTLVNGIDQKTYEQCSGFIRVHAKNLRDKSNLTKSKLKNTKSGVNGDINPLDTTWIHPESYATAYHFIDKCKVNLENLGTPEFINQVQKIVDTVGIKKISSQLNDSIERIKLIAEALVIPISYDYRSQFSKPFFKKGLTEMASLTTGMVLEGVVINVTHFGAFVDIGVDNNALIHVTCMKNCSLRVGDRVSVKIISVKLDQRRVCLELLNVFY